MSSVELIPATPEHLDLVPEMPFGNKDALLNGPSVALIIDGVHVGVGGIQIVWNGVGEVWAFFRHGAWKKHKKTIFKELRRWLDIAEVENYLHRLQALVLEDHVEGERLIKHLGFHHEGFMRCYGQQCESFNRYARVG